MDKIILENGKYEIEHNELEGIFSCKRHREDWIKMDLANMQGGKMMIAWFYEMIRLQEKFENLNEDKTRTFKFCVSYDGYASELFDIVANNQGLAESIVQSKISHFKQRWIQRIECYEIV